MAEEDLRRRLADALDPGPGFPDARLLGRTMAALETGGAARMVRRRSVLPKGPSRQLVAALLIVLLLIVAAGAFIAVQHFFANPSTVWSGCGGEFQCTTIDVPLDYSHPSNGSIGVAVIRKPAGDRSHRIGSLLVAAPAAGIDFLRENSVFYSDQFRNFDLVAFDRRGFGRTSPVRCLTDSQFDALNEVDTVLDDAKEKQVFIQAGRALAEACMQTSGRMLPFVDTTSSARDIDAIRAALGEGKITIFAFGYATFLGQTYAHLYPGHLRALAMDGVVDPSASPTDEWRQRAAGYQAELNVFLASCRASASCALGQSGDPGTRLTQLMQALDQSPLRVGSRVLSRSLIISGVLAGLDPHSWPQLDVALTNAAHSDGAALLGLADADNGRSAGGTYSVPPGALAAMTCADRAVPVDVADYDRLKESMLEASPIFGPAFQYLPLVCATWPVRPRAIPARAGAPDAPPALVVGATHDPYYPLTAAQAVHAEFPGSVLLTRDGFGVFSYTNSLCVRLAVNAYLTHLFLPPPGTLCASDYPA